MHFETLLRNPKLKLFIRMTIYALVSYQLKTAALEVVILLANVCKLEVGAKFIVGEGFIDQLLVRLLTELHADPQIIQQCIFLFNVCCRHESVTTFLVQKTQFPQDLLAFALRIGGQLKWQCDATLHRLAVRNEHFYVTFVIF